MKNSYQEKVEAIFKLYHNDNIMPKVLEQLAKKHPDFGNVKVGGELAEIQHEGKAIRFSASDLVILEDKLEELSRKRFYKYHRGNRTPDDYAEIVEMGCAWEKVAQATMKKARGNALKSYLFERNVKKAKPSAGISIQGHGITSIGFKNYSGAVFTPEGTDASIVKGNNFGDIYIGKEIQNPHGGISDSGVGTGGSSGGGAGCGGPGLSESEDSKIEEERILGSRIKEVARGVGYGLMIGVGLYAAAQSLDYLVTKDQLNKSGDCESAEMTLNPTQDLQERIRHFGKKIAAENYINEFCRGGGLGPSGSGIK